MRRAGSKAGGATPASRGESGFTLIEMMIVVAIIGLAVTIGWNAVVTLRRAAANELYALRVTTALESEMDRLRAAPPAALPAAGAFDDPELAGVPGAAGDRALMPIGPALTRVVLSVRWRTSGGQAREARLVSLLRAGER